VNKNDKQKHTTNNNKRDSTRSRTNNTKKDIIDYFPKAEEKISVVHEACDPEFKVIKDDKKKEALRQKYGLSNDVILFVGSLKRHKNILGLLDAYVDLKKKGIKQQLVIVGRYRPNESEILEKIKAEGVIYLGEVPSEDIVTLYNVSNLLVVPSLYEGFGLTALEAMACGVPVAASSTASLPEVVGEAAITFNPYKKEEISDAIFKALTDIKLRGHLIESGLARVKDFSWQKTAMKTLDLYDRIIR